MAEKKSPHHDEFMKLPLFKEEYNAKLEALGIESPEALAEALRSDERIEERHEHLKGVGPKTVEHWKEDLKVSAGEKPEAKPAPKAKKAKAAPEKKKPAEKAEKEEGEEQEPEEEKEEGEKKAEG